MTQQQSLRILLLGTKSGIERFNPILYRQKSLSKSIKGKCFYFEAVAEDDLPSLDFLPKYKEFDCICMCYEYVDQERILIFNEGGRFGNFWKKAKEKLGKQIVNHDFRVILVTRQNAIPDASVEGALSYQDELTAFEENDRFHQWKSIDREDFENSAYKLFKDVIPRAQVSFHKRLKLILKPIPYQFIIGTLIIITALASIYVHPTPRTMDEPPHVEKQDSQYNLVLTNMNNTTDDTIETVQISKVEKQRQLDIQFCNEVIKAIFERPTEYCNKLAPIFENGSKFGSKSLTKKLKKRCDKISKTQTLNTSSVKTLVDKKCAKVGINFESK